MQQQSGPSLKQSTSKSESLSKHLWTGLEHVKNGSQVYWLLARCETSWNRSRLAEHAHQAPSSELIRIRNEDSRESELPALLDACELELDRGRADQEQEFDCRCLRLSIDQQRSSYLLQVFHDERARANVEQAQNPISAQSLNCWWANEEAQLEVFGKVSRNKLAKKLARRGLLRVKEKKFDQPTDDISLCLYELEQFVRETNKNLGNIFALLAQESANKLSKLQDSASEQSWPNLEDLGEQLEANEGAQESLRPLIVMVRAPVSDSPASLYLLRLRRSRQIKAAKSGNLDEHWEGAKKKLAQLEQDDSKDSGIDLEQSNKRQPEREFLLDKDTKLIDEHVSFKASQSVQSIICYSIDLFRQLLAGSSLFKLIEEINCNERGAQLESGSPPASKSATSAELDILQISLAELKLYACVECQKLRSSIRFQWITKCLEFGLKFKEKELRKSIERRRQRQRQQQHLTREGHASNWLLPPIELAESEQEQEFRYYDLVALLMGQLLRQHFLTEALSKWCQLFERTQFKKSDKFLFKCHNNNRAPKVVIEVNLVEGPTGLACSEPDRELKEALSFVVDELASICKNLPRLETQLTLYGGSSHGGREKCIVALQEGDQLLAETKSRLATLIDRSQAADVCLKSASEFVKTNSKRKVGQLKVGSRCSSLANINDTINNKDTAADATNNWIHQDYLLIVDLVNKFRAGSEIDETLFSTLTAQERNKQPATFNSHKAAHENDNQDKEKDDDRLGELKFSCKQIRLLNHLEQELSCELDRYFDFGFVLLDCEPLNKALIKCINGERSFLVRLNLDDLLRLMERLRLQFDEIELGVDLEAAIEDYLNDRWQAKQSQQPQQPMILTAADNLNEEDDNQLGGDDDLGPALSMVDDEDHDGESFGADELEESHSVQLAKPTMSEEEEFVTALNSGNSNTQQQQQQHQHQLQFFALKSSSKLPTTDQGENLSDSEPVRSGLFDQNTTSDLFQSVAGQDRPVAPLIECQLLVAKYEYFSDVLNKELTPLTHDLELTFEGLIFLSEFVSSDQLEPAHSELISELSIRSQEFTLILGKSLRRLDQAKARLTYLNALRTKVLSKLVAEFHLLMVALSKRRLSAGGLEGAQTGDGQDESSSNNLDSIQEASDWAQKLELRFDFLVRLNSILAKEAKLLAKAVLNYKPMMSSDEQGDTIEPDDEENEGTRRRAEVLEQWRHLVTCVASLWRLAEAYETQQVKWLNSDTKRIDFNQIESTFFKFVKQLEILKGESQEELQNVNKEFKCVFETNLKDLEAKFEQFLSKRLPIFKFLTNHHLTEAHWAELTKLLNGNEEPKATSHPIQAQLCTTLAQFLELSLDKYVDKLEEMNKQATVEYELTMFLLAEAGKSANNSAEGAQAQLRSLNVSTWLENWSDSELVVAASRFIVVKLSQSKINTNCDNLAKKLVAIHSKVKQYLRLKYWLNLDDESGRRVSLLLHPKARNKSDKSVRKLTLRSHQLLTSPELVRPSLFVEFLRLFTKSWIESQLKLSFKIGQLEEDSRIIKGHLRDIEALVERVNFVHENDLKVATRESEQMMVYLERETMKLELEREILATREALALEKQRDALKIRDDCIRQVSERAIPAIRAATRALDCLDEKSLRALRSIRPHPPDSVRLVIEAVCLLKSCVPDTRGRHLDETKNQTQQVSPQTIHNHNQNKQTTLEPERRFDALHGKILEDYWPVASRMLNGTHSCRFLSDLRRVDKKSIPSSVMRLIRRKYLSSSKFNLRFIEKVSHECALLAKWLIAVDVFDRVINVVKPNYKCYIEAERKLAELLGEVNNRRRQIESISNELQQMEDSFEIKVKNKMSLTSSLDECKLKLEQMESTKEELLERQSICARELDKFESKRLKLASRCLLSSARTVYIEAMRPDERKPMTDLLRALVASLSS